MSETPCPDHETAATKSSPVRRGAVTVAALSADWIEIACDRCRREGRYRRATLQVRFGPDETLPDVLRALTGCQRRGFSDFCQARFKVPPA